MLSDYAKELLERLRFRSEALAPGCPCCRYSSGCLSCDPEKALTYYLGKEGREWALKRLEDL